MSYYQLTSIHNFLIPLNQLVSNGDSSDISYEFSLTFQWPLPSLRPSNLFELYILTWTQYTLNHKLNSSSVDSPTKILL